jgi:hypothetical protein
MGLVFGLGLVPEEANILPNMFITNEAITIRFKNKWTNRGASMLLVGITTIIISRRLLIITRGPPKIGPVL